MTALAIILGYLIGAIPFSLLVSSAIGKVDLQRTGSGNAGAKNTFVSAGPLAGAIVLLLDAGKGALAVVLGNQLVGPEVGALAGAAAAVGHCFSPYLAARWIGKPSEGWKMTLRRVGGKGLATGMMVLLLVAWPTAFIAMGTFLLLLLILRTDETIPTVIAVLLSVPAVWWWTQNLTVTLAMLILALVVVVKHLPDMREAFWVDGPPAS